MNFDEKVAVAAGGTLFFYVLLLNQERLILIKKCLWLEGELYFDCASFVEPLNSGLFHRVLFF